MKKISIMASVLLFGSMLNADIPIKTGWQLLGATKDMNTTIFNNTCIDYMWKYDTTDTLNSPWQVHIANGTNYTHSFGTMATLAKSEGYWVFGNANCVIQVSSSNSVSSSSSIAYQTTPIVLGNPLKTNYPNDPFARNIWDMSVYDNKIYFGGGNSANEGPSPNAGAVPLMVFNGVDFSMEGSVDDEQIDIFTIESHLQIQS